MRDVLARRTLEDAVAAALHPARASSYNWVLADRARALNVEGSATTAVTTAPGPDGLLVHANHYEAPAMLVYEADPAYAEGSARRHRRAAELLEEAASRGPLTARALRNLLADHDGVPDALCRHAVTPTETGTVFWCAANVTTGTIEFGRGTPCAAGPAQRHRFAEGSAA